MHDTRSKADSTTIMLCNNLRVGQTRSEATLIIQRYFSLATCFNPLLLQLANQHLTLSIMSTIHSVAMCLLFSIPRLWGPLFPKRGYPTGYPQLQNLIPYANDSKWLKSDCGRIVDCYRRGFFQIAQFPDQRRSLCALFPACYTMRLAAVSPRKRIVALAAWLCLCSLFVRWDFRATLSIVHKIS